MNEINSGFTPDDLDFYTAADRVPASKIRNLKIAVEAKITNGDELTDAEREWAEEGFGYLAALGLTRDTE